MDIYVDDKKITTLRLLPTTKIWEVKQILGRLLNEMGIGEYSVKIIFNNGTELSPLVFQNNNYDQLDFSNQKDLLDGGSIWIRKKNLYVLIHSNDEGPYTPEVFLADSRLEVIKYVQNQIAKDKNSKYVHMLSGLEVISDAVYKEEQARPPHTPVTVNISPLYHIPYTPLRATWGDLMPGDSGSGLSEEEHDERVCAFMHLLDQIF